MTGGKKYVSLGDLKGGSPLRENLSRGYSRNQESERKVVVPLEKSYVPSESIAIGKKNSEKGRFYKANPPGTKKCTSQAPQEQSTYLENPGANRELNSGVNS